MLDGSLRSTIGKLIIASDGDEIPKILGKLSRFTNKNRIQRNHLAKCIGQERRHAQPTALPYIVRFAYRVWLGRAPRLPR